MATTGPYVQALPVAGTIIAVSWGDQVVRAINYLQGTPLAGDDERPFAVLRQTVAQALTTGAGAAVLFDAESIDAGSTGGGHSTTTNTSRWTCPPGKPGWYRGSWVAGFVSNATNDRSGYMLINGSGTRYGQYISDAASGRATYITGADVFFMNPGDYVELVAQQWSGGTLNTEVASGGCRLTIVQERMQ